MNRALPYRLCRSSGRVRWWLLWRRHQAYSRCGCGRVPAQCEYPRWFCWRESPGTLVRSVSSRLCGRGVWRLPQRHLPHMYVCMDVYNEPAEARATCISGDPAWPKGGGLGPMRCLSVASSVCAWPNCMAICSAAVQSARPPASPYGSKRASAMSRRTRVSNQAAGYHRLGQAVRSAIRETCERARESGTRG
jgi:hypothetical protein